MLVQNWYGWDCVLRKAQTLLLDSWPKSTLRARSGLGHLTAPDGLLELLSRRRRPTEADVLAWFKNPMFPQTTHHNICASTQAKKA
mmetsp:Transcript_162882/g.312858  ORF Transcript_162882/g.312858 Transcript_162882/m.312858 type:complete len:86 (+) Transcript_162882:250-507(+)